MNSNHHYQGRVIKSLIGPWWLDISGGSLYLRSPLRDRFIGWGRPNGSQSYSCRFRLRRTNSEGRLFIDPKCIWYVL